jgi:curved DNA-binding protein CbpA
VTELLDRPAGADDEDEGERGVDAFRVLGLPYSPDMDDEDVRQAYLHRLKAAHPDNGGDPEAAAVVTAAYDALRSGVRRGELLTAAMVDRGDPSPPHRRRPGRPRGSGAQPGVVPDAARRAELRAQVAASRAAQGLPPFITDEATLAKIADLLVVMRHGGGTRFRARKTPRPLGAAWPGWDAPWWDEAASKPGGPREISTWRRERRRRRMPERDLVSRSQESAGLGNEVPGRLQRSWSRVRHGRPGWLALRVVLAVLVPLVASWAAPGDPAVAALGVGSFTWLVLTARFDLASRTRR